MRGLRWRVKLLAVEQPSTQTTAIRSNDVLRVELCFCLAEATASSPGSTPRLFPELHPHDRPRGRGTFAQRLHPDGGIRSTCSPASGDTSVPFHALVLSSCVAGLEDRGTRVPSSPPSTDRPEHFRSPLASRSLCIVGHWADLRFWRHAPCHRAAPRGFLGVG